MCGIVGAVAQRDVALILLEGLKRLEYRGYDSAGIAIINQQQKMLRIRTVGKVHMLEEALQTQPLFGHTGIAHTRWATHGKPSEHNAHPHTSHDEVAIVHNGIIENYATLRKELTAAGYEFTSQTDTETIAHLLHQQLQQKNNLLAAVNIVSKKLEGALAIGIMYKKEPGRLIAVRRGSPLVVGIGIGEHFIASDHLALLPVTQRFIYLEEGDIADVNRENITIYDAEGEPVERNIHTADSQRDIADKGPYRHFMLKEIFEQPQAVTSATEARLGQYQILENIFGDRAQKIFLNIKRIQIVACGTSYHAGLIARCWLESLAGLPCQVEIASEIRYRKPVVEPNTLFVVLSQSGETADTLSALRLAKQSGYAATLAICNVPESAMVREADLTLMMRAGPEIGVASTKAFTSQLVSLLLLTAAVGKHHQFTAEKEQNLIKQLERLPNIITETLQLETEVQHLAKLFLHKEHSLFLGRGVYYPVALEGALKLKEISYIHAEAYPAGELKHGPIALVDKEMPIIFLVPNDELLDKLKSNIEEVRARGGELIIFTDKNAKLETADGMRIISMPEADTLIAPIIYTIPLQLLAYHVAVLKGTDVDQPRNLAKSVTVE